MSRNTCFYELDSEYTPSPPVKKYHVKKRDPRFPIFFNRCFNQPCQNIRVFICFSTNQPCSVKKWPGSRSKTGFLNWWGGFLSCCWPTWLLQTTSAQILPGQDTKRQTTPPYVNNKDCDWNTMFTFVIQFATNRNGQIADWISCRKMHLRAPFELVSAAHINHIIESQEK